MLHHSLKFFSNLFFPPLCAGCDEILNSTDSIFCDACLVLVKPLEGAGCTICATPFENSNTLSHPCSVCLSDPPAFDRHLSLYTFTKPVRHLIHNLKYNKNFSSLSFLAEQFYEKHQTIFQDHLSPSYLVAVPLSQGRLAERTYNQSVEFSKKLQKVFQKKLVNDSITFIVDGGLEKIRETLPQTLTQNREERLANLKGAFSWLYNKMDGERVYLVDDLTSTTSTLRETAATLKKAGAGEVIALTIAINAL